MRHSIFKFISYILVFCVSGNALPFNLFHIHDHDHLCEATNIILEQDECHARTFHNLQLESKTCEHRSHLDKAKENCDFCQFEIKLSKKFTFLNIVTFYVEASKCNTVFELIQFLPESCYSDIQLSGPPTYFI